MLQRLNKKNIINCSKGHLKCSKAKVFTICMLTRESSLRSLTTKGTSCTNRKWALSNTRRKPNTRPPLSTLFRSVVHQWGSTHVLLDYLCRSTCLSLGKSQCFTCCLHARLAHVQLHGDGNPHSCFTALPGKKTWREEKRVPASLSDLHSMADTRLFYQGTTEESDQAA